MGHIIPGGTGFSEFDKRVRQYVDREDIGEVEFVFSE